MKSLLDGLKALGPARLAALAAVAPGHARPAGAARAQQRRPAHGAALRRPRPARFRPDDGSARPRPRPVPACRRRHPRSWCRPTRSRPRACCSPEGPALRRLRRLRESSTAATGFAHDRRSSRSINETRALEGELARTIRAISGVRAARVHLVLPQREPFAREAPGRRRPACCSPWPGAARLDREGVQAILNLVAAAVPGLRPQNIAIVDTRGNLLARAGAPVGAAGMALSDRGAAPRHRTAPLPRGGGDAGAQPRPRPRARGGRGADGLRPGQRDRGELRSGRPGRRAARRASPSDQQSTEAAPTVTVQNNLPNADAGSRAPARRRAARKTPPTTRSARPSAR